MDISFESMINQESTTIHVDDLDPINKTIYIWAYPTLISVPIRILFSINSNTSTVVQYGGIIVNVLLSATCSEKILKSIANIYYASSIG